jgi:Gram positive anchor.
MDKATRKPLLVDGKQVTATRTFIASASKGEVKVLFSFNSLNLKDGQEIVVYEKLYEVGSDKVIASHADINDKGQTVTVKKPNTPTPPIPNIPPYTPPYTPNTPNTPSTSSTHTRSGSLPQTGEKAAPWIAVAGGVLIIGALGYWIYRRKQ